ncbi:MAG: hypothetical protein IT384_05140 [Deltaproteobacteria bacterium]|nr:hypothetical protein [Deltaproteobacteria bacterium]
MRTLPRHLSPFVVLALALAACGDDATTNPDASVAADATTNRDATPQQDAAPGQDAAANDDAAANPDAAPTDSGVAGPATFTQVYAVIQANCSCHVGGASGGLAMPNASAAHQALVSVAAATVPCTGETRVIPNNAANSVLFRKVSGTNLCGPRMPFNGGLLGATETQTIESWINDGAQNN